MAIKQVSWNPLTKVALVQADDAVAPGGSTVVGKFDHDVPADDHIGPYKEGHVLYHHVQEVLYHIGWTNMQAVSIQVE